MGVIYNGNVGETKVYQAYGLTVYGKINRYLWTISNNEENALITIRIIDTDGNDIFSMYMGNNCILQSRINDTMDNFLWWIVEDQPDTYTIEKQVYKSLCASDCLFNTMISKRKIEKRRKEEAKKRIVEREEKLCEDIDRIKTYCMNKGLFYYIGYEEAVLIKANTNHDKSIIAEAQQRNDVERMKQFVDFIRTYPDNKSAQIVVSGSIEEILQYIK